jgi:hypothetical protein
VAFFEVGVGVEAVEEASLVGDGSKDEGVGGSTAMELEGAVSTELEEASEGTAGSLVEVGGCVALLVGTGGTSVGPAGSLKVGVVSSETEDDSDTDEGAGGSSALEVGSVGTSVELDGSIEVGVGSADTVMETELDVSVDEDADELSSVAEEGSVGGADESVAGAEISTEEGADETELGKEEESASLLLPSKPEQRSPQFCGRSRRRRSARRLR